MTTQHEQARYLLTLSEDAIRLAATLKAACAEADKIVLFTGATERDGVSAVAAQVALALAQMDQDPVLLLDANLHTPSVHTTFQVQKSPGLSDLIEQRATVDEALHRSQHSMLSILPVGTSGRDALALFPAPGCSTLIQVLRKEFRFVIVDSPPLLQFVDTALFVPYANGVVIAATAGAHRGSEILEVKHQLDRLKATVLGIVLCETTCLSS